MRTVNVFLFLYLRLNNFVYNFSDSHPDTYLSITQLAKKYGYPMENHEVITEDGYILTMFRIPHGKNGTGVNPKPILLMHGLFGQAEFYIIGGMHNSSLAYFMADNGYDVWLGNTRGTEHSRRHVKLNPDLPEFWNFSWHEIGVFDLPAKIDYILLKVNKTRIFYVGLSQGGTTLFVLSTERPSYQRKIIAASLLGPAAYVVSPSNPLFRLIVQRNDVFMKSAELNQQFEFPDQTNSFKHILSSMCIDNKIFDTLCQKLIEVFNGAVSGELNPEMIPLFFQILPTISIRQIVHYLQLSLSGHFRKWDYGSRRRNIEAYGLPEPPDYPLQNISIPIEIYTSLGDSLVSYKNINATCKQLANCKKIIVMANPKWAHMDYTFAINGAKMINEPILHFMNGYKTIE